MSQHSQMLLIDQKNQPVKIKVVKIFIKNMNMREYFNPKREHEPEVGLIRCGDLVLDPFGAIRIFVRYDEQLRSAFIKNEGAPDSEAMEVRPETIHKIVKPDLKVGDVVKNDQGEEKTFVCFDDENILQATIEDSKTKENEKVDWRLIHFEFFRREKENGGGQEKQERGAV